MAAQGCRGMRKFERQKVGRKCGNYAASLAVPALKLTKIGGAPRLPLTGESRASPWDARELHDGVTSILHAAIRVGRGVWINESL